MSPVLAAIWDDLRAVLADHEWISDNSACTCGVSFRPYDPRHGRREPRPTDYDSWLSHVQSELKRRLG